MSNLPALLLDSDNTELALSPRFLERLETQEDYESAFGTVSQQKNTCLWWEADLILDCFKKYGKRLDLYRAGQLMNNSTYQYYLRTASAFPPHTRIASISFNHHYQASFADEWNSKTLSFSGEQRFDYAEKAADQEMSTRKLKEVMKQDEEGATKKEEEPRECVWCKNKEGITTPIEKYSIYRHSPTKTTPTELELHEFCFGKLLDYIYEF